MKKDLNENENQMEQGKIYFISYGGNTQIVGRFKETKITDHFFYDLLHYWNGYESFRKSKQPCCKTGITEIRPASQAEKMSLIRFELENDCI